MNNVYQLFPNIEDVSKNPNTKQQLINLFDYVSELESTIKHLELRLNQLEENCDVK